MTYLLGGRVEQAPVREYGRTEVEVNNSCKLFDGVNGHTVCWMSHTDYIAEMAPGFEIAAHSKSCPVAAVQNPEKNLYAVQFHPEVVHTVEGTKMLSNFLFKVCGCKGDWKMDSFVETSIRALREKIGDKKVLCALSGGVDSSVAAAVSYTHLDVYKRQESKAPEDGIWACIRSFSLLLSIFCSPDF